MEKIYQIRYMYEISQEEYVDINRPDLGIKKSHTLIERSELAIGKTPDKALKNWKRMVARRGDKKRVYVIDIFEHTIKKVTEEYNYGMVFSIYIFCDVFLSYSR